MRDFNDLERWTDRDLVDLRGDKIGTVDDLYYDETTGQVEWFLVRTGLFGTKKTLVPTSLVRPAGEDLRVDLSKDDVKDAPKIDDDQELSDQGKRELFRYYGLSYVGEPAGMGSTESGTAAPEHHDAAMIRAQEELSMRKARRPKELVRLQRERKHKDDREAA